MPEDTLRDSLDKAFDKVEGEVKTDTAAPVTEQKTGAAVTTEQKTDAPVVEQKTEVKTEPKTEVKTEVKTEQKVEQKTEAKPGEKKVPAPEVKIEQPKIFKAPVSWKPGIREAHWDKLPVEVRAEISRREREIDVALANTAEARKGMEALNGVFTRYKDYFEFEKVHPMQSITNVLDIARTLRFAQPAQKAQMMASVISGFGVDLKLLDQALVMAGGGGTEEERAASAGSKHIQEVLSKELAPIKEVVADLQGRRQAARQRSEDEMRAEIATFAADPKNIYFDIVKNEMADLMELAASRGHPINLQEAYRRAILANNDLAAEYSRSVLESHSGTVNSPAVKSENLSDMSVTGSPGAPAAHTAGVNLRSDIEAAVAKHAR